jgi:hypothetical protein
MTAVTAALEDGDYRPVRAAAGYIDVDGTDAGLQLILRGLATTRHDSRDGYGRHTRDARHIDTRRRIAAQDSRVLPRSPTQDRPRHRLRETGLSRGTSPAQTSTPIPASA